MNQENLNNINLWLANRNIMDKNFKYNKGIMNHSAALLYTVNGESASQNDLLYCKRLIRDKTGTFSYFRGLSEQIMTVLLAMSDNPDALLDQTMKIYDDLKGNLPKSSFLPISSLLIARNSEGKNIETIKSRMIVIYKNMKKNHRFLTGDEALTWSALMALSDRDAEEMMHESEMLYRELKPSLNSSTGTLSLAYSLSMEPRPLKEKYQLVHDLSRTLIRHDIKINPSYGLPAIGSLALSTRDYVGIAKEILDIDVYLKQQPGFGFWGGISTKDRHLYAAMIIQINTIKAQGESLENIVTNHALNIIIAQQTAMIAVVAATAATSAAVNSGN